MHTCTLSLIYTCSGIWTPLGTKTIALTSEVSLFHAGEGFKVGTWSSTLVSQVSLYPSFKRYILVYTHTQSPVLSL